MRILVIEDDAKTSAYLRKGLAESGFVVDHTAEGRNGLKMALSRTHDLIVLDLMLPDFAGTEILSELRHMRRSTPVLVLTALDSVADRVRGLDLGADDYLVKPFAFSELLARIRSLLRRGQAILGDVVRVADLEIDLKGLSVTRAGSKLRLTPKEFSLLALLAQHPGEIQSRTLIAEHVWNMNFDSDTNVVDVAISRLRRKIDDPFETKLLHSVRGMGYVLEER